MRNQPSLPALSPSFGSASILRLCTAGTVDDGKSTLIGRLLYDSRAVYDDQLQAVEIASRSRSAGPIDFSLFTDGLRAEREQGITIDVAYRYFSTPRRSFILADTPGHEQYTRNMATGASTADVAILLIDARHGVRAQTRRHARIARLLGISTFVLAVNKMDLVGFERDIFDRIRLEFAELLPDAIACPDPSTCSGSPRAKSRGERANASRRVHAIPVSALLGDNVTTRSVSTPWFDGPTVLEFLETVDVPHRAAANAFRFPVQLVVRPSHDFRGYAGQIASGVVHPGDRVTVWPSRQSTRVKRIVTWEGDLDRAPAPMSITLVLEDDLDIGRGDLIAAGSVECGTRFDADVVWMDERALDPGRVYILKHGTRSVPAEVDRPLALNDIGVVSVTTLLPLAFDRYEDDRATGSFILIDPATNVTSGAGMIIAARQHDDGIRVRLPAAERLAYIARTAATDREAIDAVRRLLDEMLAAPKLGSDATSEGGLA